MTPLFWFSLAKYAAAAAAGAALLFFIYATPRIDGLQADIAKQTAADATATAAFESAARAKDQTYATNLAQSHADTAAAIKRRDAAVAALSAGHLGVQRAVDAYAASHACVVPEAAGAPTGADGPAKTLGGLLESCSGLASTSAGDAAALSDQLRGLQAYITGAMK